MRLAACLLSLVLPVAAMAEEAAPELITLRDGRALTGVYDEGAGTVTLTGAGRAVVRVDARDIVSRAPAPDAPAVKPRSDAEPHRAAGPSPLAVEAITKKRQAEEARATADAAAKAYTAARHAAVRDYFMTTADLTPLVVKVPDNPTKAQLEDARKLGEFNKRLADLREWRTLRAHVSGEDDPLLSQGAVAEFARMRGVAWLLDL